MESTNFALGILDRVDAITIFVIGIIATTWLMAIRWLLEKSQVVKYGTGRIVGSFLIPWDAKNSVFDYGIQFVIGLSLTTLYGFAYHFLRPQSVWSFVTIGTGLGLIHGVFISIFTVALGYSGRGSASGTRPFEFIAFPLNILSQAIFGTLVGAAFGYAELTMLFWPFIEMTLVVEVAFFVVGFVLSRY